MPDMKGVPTARHMMRAKDLVDTRYRDPLTVDDMSRAAGLSIAHFSREFKRTFGESPHQYLLTRRLERAAWPPAESLVRIPRCVAQAYARPKNRTFREDAISARS
jgi:AraC-like DNA-binding protein